MSSERFREIVDLPDKAAIGIGAGLILLSPFAPALFPVGALLFVGGGVGLGITRGFWPKKTQA